MVPTWLHILSIVAIATGFVCAAIVVVDEWRDPQHMWIMNLVWPPVALFAGPLALAGYFVWGRLATDSRMKAAMEADEPMPNIARSSFAAMVGKGSAHCGAGCALGDIVAEWFAFFVPAVALWLGWKSVFPDKIFAVWILDFIVAFCFGIAFQYFSIKPMRDLTPRQGLVQAVKADTLSLASWQVGMYGFMAIAHFWIFAHVLGTRLEVASVEFWFMMQIAMLCGFATSYPINWWLLKAGVKEKM
ncbi:DUF4396 domain-containing protein [Pararhizobium mangrovi]|uniref:DUF4396 domain-containing protein n=1 Tax=Pararhizobium mangrovi TaxID=2590452 RepID=A0A506TZP9_9HYPH|nr:DUF4396 domain-containing protein [Pararhizobium mangrovi]TPW26990.1 DUF4396 domain-containing protein [Pararhizobium mangrovi]